MADIVTTNLDSGADSPAAARAQLLEAVQRVNRLASTAVGDGASMFGSNDAGGYWQAANQEGINQEAGALLVNIRSMGADITGATDSYSALIAAFTKSNYVLIPTGCTISIDTTWEPAQGQVLWMGPNTVLKRRAAAASESPVIWMHRSSISVIGSGASSRIISEKSCRDGVISIGAANMATPIGNDMFWCRVANVSIEGSIANELTGEYGQIAGNPDVGIKLYGPQIDTIDATTIGIQASYFHTFDNLVLKKLNYGMSFIGFSNGNKANNIHFERLGNPTIRGRAIDFRGCEGNVFTNCWHHYADDSDGIYSENLTANTILYPSFGHQVLNFCSEAGGTSRMYNIQAGSWMRIGGFDYGGGESINNGTSNRIETHKKSRIPGPAQIENGVSSDFPLQIFGATGQSVSFLIVRNSANVTQFKVEADGSAQALAGFYPGTTSAPGVFWKSGAGSPEGVISAPLGSLWTNKNGGAGLTLYTKEAGGSGSTGWVAK